MKYLFVGLAALFALVVVYFLFENQNKQSIQSTQQIQAKVAGGQASLPTNPTAQDINAFAGVLANLDQSDIFNPTGDGGDNS